MVVHHVGPGRLAVNEDAAAAGRDDGFAQRDVVHPVRHALHVLRQQDRAAVTVLGVLVAFVQQSRILQIRHPLGRGHVAALQFQLDLQHGMGEAVDFILLQDPVRLAMPDLHIVQVVPALRDHAQVGIERDSHRGIEWDLECRAHALRSHGWDQLLADAHLRDFPHQLLPFIGLLLRFAFGQHFLLLLRDRVRVLHDLLHFGVGDHETLLHRNFPSPLVVVRLALHKDGSWLADTVPTQTQCDRTGRLVEPTVIQLQLIVIDVHRIRELRIALAGTRLLQEDREMTQDGVLDATHVFRLDPVLGRRSEEGLRCILIFRRHMILTQRRINLRQSDHQITVIPTHPGLRMHAGNVKCLARIVRQMLVMLLQDFVKSHEVDVDVLFDAQEIFRDLVGQRHDGGVGFDADLGFRRVDLVAQFGDLFERELFHLGQFRFDHLEERFLRCG
mmetsp:Transcript_10434/g.29771  ORF Transcript_10434/g.29771 Transcript_10434/m.29771 type:complete len:445 (-) Transcript_10434:273-1607(-)